MSLIWCFNLMINWNVCKCLFVNFYFKFFGEKWENVLFYEVDFFLKKKESLLWKGNLIIWLVFLGLLVIKLNF